MTACPSGVGCVHCGVQRSSDLANDQRSDIWPLWVASPIRNMRTPPSTRDFAAVIDCHRRATTIAEPGVLDAVAERQVPTWPGRSPKQALQTRQAEKPDLFVKRVQQASNRALRQETKIAEEPAVVALYGKQFAGCLLACLGKQPGMRPVPRISVKHWQSQP